MKRACTLSRPESFFTLDISQFSQQALGVRWQTGNMHSACACRAKRWAHLTHLSERLSKASRPGLASESHLAEISLHAHARGHTAGLVVRSMRPRRNTRGVAASQPRSTSQISQELQGAERMREQETPDVLRRDLQPAEIKTHSHPCPALPPTYTH